MLYNIKGMVSWINVKRAINDNTERAFSVEKLLLTEPSVTYERFPIVRLPLRAAIQPTVVPPPAPVPVLPVVAPEPLVARTPQLQISAEEEEDLIQPPPPASRPAIKIPAAVPEFLEPSPKLPSSPKKTEVRPLYEPKTTKRQVDPLVLGIQDIMYSRATYRTQYQIECEEAVRLETELPIVYKSQAGRSRGWTKTNLEILIKPRCAIGGNLRDLDKAKGAFHWNLVRTDKYQAAFLDFVCIVKKIRIAVWFEEEKRVVLFPAADHTESLGEGNIPLYHVTSSGFERHGLQSGADLSAFCGANNWVLVPPASVYHAMGHLKLDELENVGRSLGMADVEGNKQARVERIVSYKLHQRLCAKNI